MIMLQNVIVGKLTCKIFPQSLGYEFKFQIIILMFEIRCIEPTYKTVIANLKIISDQSLYLFYSNINMHVFRLQIIANLINNQDFVQIVMPSKNSTFPISYIAKDLATLLVTKSIVTSTNWSKAFFTCRGWDWIVFNTYNTAFP